MTESTQEESVVAIYATHDGAEAGIKALQQAGLDMKRLSLVGKDFHTEGHALGFYTAGAFGGHLGGAPILRASVRVTVGGGMAMAVTAAIGRLLGVAVG